jgi:hypothetical protein
MGYNCFGKVRSSAYLTQYRFVSIKPEDERMFLSTNFTPEEVRSVANNIQNSVPGEDLYFALYSEGTNAQKSLEELRSWLQTNGILNKSEPSKGK